MTRPSTITRDAHLLAIMLFIFASYQLIHIVSFLLTDSLFASIARLANQPWFYVLLTNYATGIAFGMVFIILRSSTAPIVLSPIATCVVFLVLGSPFLLAYTVLLLIATSSIRAALLPYSHDGYNIIEVSTDTRIPHSIGTAFIFFLIANVGTLLYALLTSSMHVLSNLISNEKLMTTLSSGIMCGLLFTIVFAFTRERSMKLKVVWLFAFLLFNNVATCLYVLSVVLWAHRTDGDFRSVLLAKHTA